MNNPHKNARTCVYSREQIVVRYDNGQSAAEIARSFGISVRTVVTVRSDRAIFLASTFSRV